MSETVIREVTNGIWTFSRPFARFGLFPVGGRSTAVKLRDGGVWVLASTPLDDETKDQLKTLGPVRYIIGADAVHYLFLDQYKKEYPAAKLIAPSEAIENVSKAGKNLTFDGAWGRDPPGSRYGFEDEIEHCYFSGFKNKDVAFLHKESKSLIQADLLMNLPPKEQYAKAKSSPILSSLSNLNPNSWGHPYMTYALGVDKEAMRRDAKTVSGWDFSRIIPCHGDVIETEAKKAWNTVFQKFLD
ncbi:hypothetical protein DFP72DRAFT_890144 [Ephemerocybe angulata]|uniref:DUF4336 domain-containing protein n=1 Tax=Ephemerocybe angulata TaxID=980116 RepID=A0A8H6HEN2_9AGAR|nr:hypothetical protein DFP72DRAFT_927558 [Tulosesus angulatus]KAF6757622.1 hypothetical protein DFP72DRAFT_890144 [Tulosesus angulatus]